MVTRVRGHQRALGAPRFGQEHLRNAQNAIRKMKLSDRHTAYELATAERHDLREPEL